MKWKWINWMINQNKWTEGNRPRVVYKSNCVIILYFDGKPIRRDCFRWHLWSWGFNLRRIKYIGCPGSWAGLSGFQGLIVTNRSADWQLEATQMWLSFPLLWDISTFPKLSVSFSKLALPVNWRWSFFDFATLVDCEIYFAQQVPSTFS